MKSFRAYVYTRNLTVLGLEMSISVTFRNINADTESDAKEAAKVMAKAFGMIPEGMEIACAIATENKPEAEAETETDKSEN